MNFTIGHLSIGEGTGVSVVISREGAVGGVSVRGSSPATRETDLLASGNAVDKVNAVVLSGGSAFGLDAASGVMRYLAEQGVGFNTSDGAVPIVVGASLYDLGYKGRVTPSAEDGYRAAANATEIELLSGAIGAGTGATVGKIMGAATAVKSGLGMAKIMIGDVEMIAIVAVNAFGNVYDYTNGELISGATLQRQPIDIIQAILTSAATPPIGENTTIACLLTNMKMTKTQANKLADIAHDGYAMTIRPVHTMLDGDAIFVMSDGTVDGDFVKLSCLAPIVIAEAVMKAARSVK